MKKENTLTEKEFELMRVLWSNNSSPKTAPDIISQSLERTWSSNSIHKLLNSLIEKGFVEVIGKMRCTKVNGRIYKAKVSQDDYATAEIRRIFDDNSKIGLRNIISNLFDGSKSIKDDETILELEEMLNKHR